MLDDVKNLHAFVADSTPTFGRGYAAPLISAVILFIIDWRLACIALGVMLIGMFVMSLAMRDSKAMYKMYNVVLGQINAAVIEFIQAMPVVRIFDDGTSSFKRYLKALERYREAYIEWMKISSIPARIALFFLAPLPTILALTAGGILFINAGTLSLPSLIASLFLSTGMVDAFMPLMWLNNFLRKSKAAADRIEELLTVQAMPTVENGPVPREMTIRFDSVTFGYENRDENALTDVNFVVEHGTTTALVGPSGAGKSTVARLLPRFWDVTNGAVTIGDIDIRQMDNEHLMNTVTFVFQDTYLFHDTLANNIRMAKPGATDEMVTAAAKAAQIHDFIMTLPEEYDTRAGDRGTRLSGGQRQRITIARAILRDAPIVVLDEATAFADPESEEEIIKAIACLTKNKTVITIAHRLSTITHVDQILVFDHGRIVEKGKHIELLLNNGLYARLWANYEAAQNWDLHSKGAVNV
jgi:ATP-binding cassette subfamily B protein